MNHHGRSICSKSGKPLSSAVPILPRKRGGRKPKVPTKNNFLRTGSTRSAVYVSRRYGPIPLRYNAVSVAAGFAGLLLGFVLSMGGVLLAEVTK